MHKTVVDSLTGKQPTNHRSNILIIIPIPCSGYIHSSEHILRRIITSLSLVNIQPYLPRFGDGHFGFVTFKG